MLKTRLTKNCYHWMISKGLAILLHKALFFIHLPHKYQSQRLKNLVGIPLHLAKLMLFSLSLPSQAHALLPQPVQPTIGDRVYLLAFPAWSVLQ
ncbi:MAG: hypothetical protein F6K26_07390 [Moorea sp. SIO2I5]|nr:hypothetical protein [Moorena sp. SIO2I5]